MGQNKFTVLTAGDDLAGLDELSHMLQANYRVIIAKSGPAALERAQRDEPDLILLDTVMSGMSGFDVLSALKESESTRSIPVICITGLNSVADEEKSLALGAVDYITKPFRQSVVKARTATHLRIVEQMRLIEQLGLLDALTKVPNRKSFNNRLATEWRRAIREKTPLSILMVDVDEFRQFNDTYGYQQGDEVLKDVAVVIKSTFKRSADFLARWGGEEFAAILPNTAFPGALTIAEAIRANIEAALHVTASIGISSITPFPESSMTEFVEQADKALCLAKESGRNQVKGICKDSAAENGRATRSNTP